MKPGGSVILRRSMLGHLQVFGSYPGSEKLEMEDPSKLCYLKELKNDDPKNYFIRNMLLSLSLGCFSIKSPMNSISEPPPPQKKNSSY